jgi:hypothetical protein
MSSGGTADALPVGHFNSYSSASNLDGGLMRATYLHRAPLTFGMFILCVGFVCSQARAATMVQTVILSPSGSDDNVTNGHLLAVFDLSPSFNQFNPVLGPLNSAILAWNATGSLTVGGNNEGAADMSYETSSDQETWNIYGGSTVLNFALNGSESLNLTAVTGTGKFAQGAFTETYQLQQGYFPASFSTGTTTGTFTLTYDYGNDAPAPIPEPASILMVSPAAGLLALWLRLRCK